jgi:peptide deformylase
MIRKIITDNYYLTIKSLEVDKIHESELIEKISSNLVDTAKHHNAAGLAAIQIGDAVNIFCAKIRGEYRVFVNPEMIVMQSQGRKQEKEGCLSFPNREPILIKRYKVVKLRANGGDWEKFKGFEARIIQHEMDHLDGRLV